jgi:predicted acyl esterase
MTKAGVASASWTSTALAGSLPRMGVSFETAPLTAALEVTGPVNLVLWVSSTTADMDVFATLRNIDRDGKDVWEIGQQQQPVPVAKGWLRVSHRKLDPRLSLPYRPYHSHDERQWLKPGEKVQVQVEIWPTCMVFRKGHRIRLDIQPRDGVGSAPYTHYSADYNVGDNTIFTGGGVASHLLLPVIPRT